MLTDHFVCPYCKQTLFTTREEYRCQSCGLTFPLVDGVPDFYASSTPAEEVVGPDQTWLDPKVVAARDIKYRYCARTLRGMGFCIRDIVSRTGASSRILEVGMGTGHFTQWLAEAVETGTKIFSFDFSWPIIRVAQNNTRGFYNVVLFRANSRGLLPFEDESFDVILLRLAPLGAHGIPNVQAGFMLLKPGGWYYEAGWERTQYATSPTAWAIQHGFESAEARQWQYWRTQTLEEQNATRFELEHLASQGSVSAASTLERGAKTRVALDGGKTIQVMTTEQLLIAHKPYFN